MAAPSGRVYSAYDRAYQRKHAQKYRDRMKARYWMVKKYGERALEGKDVDHVKALAAGGSNAPSNWRVRSVHSNRADKSY